MVKDFLGAFLNPSFCYRATTVICKKKFLFIDGFKHLNRKLNKFKIIRLKHWYSFDGFYFNIPEKLSVIRCYT